MANDPNMADARAGLQAATTQQANLKAAVAAGQLSIEPGTGEAAAKVCEEMRDTLRFRMRDAQNLGVRAPFGDSKVGNAVTARFTDKAITGPDSLVEILKAWVVVMENMAENYRAAGRMYQQTDEGNAHAFRGKT